MLYTFFSLREESWLSEFKNRLLRGDSSRRLEQTVPSAHLTKYFLGDQMKNKEMGESCNKYRGQESFIQGSGGKTWRRENFMKT
jgi:hypothetical protein